MKRSAEFKESDIPEKCTAGCECKNTGMVTVVNEGQFPTKSETVDLPCNGIKGYWMHYHRFGAKRTVRYDPKTMHLAGEVFQRSLFKKEIR